MMVWDRGSPAGRNRPYFPTAMGEELKGFGMGF